MPKVARVFSRFVSFKDHFADHSNVQNYRHIKGKCLKTLHYYTDAVTIIPNNTGMIKIGEGFRWMMNWERNFVSLSFHLLILLVAVLVWRALPMLNCKTNLVGLLEFPALSPVACFLALYVCACFPSSYPDYLFSRARHRLTRVVSICFELWLFLCVCWVYFYWPHALWIAVDWVFTAVIKTTKQLF